MYTSYLRPFMQFAASTAEAVVKEEPPVFVVVATGLSLVFAILVILWLVLLLEGKLFQSLDEKKKQKEAQAKAEKLAEKPAPAAPVTPAPAPVPQVEPGIPPEVVAAIAAAVTQIEGGKYTLRSVQTTQKGRGQWGLAGVISYTEPF